MISEGIPKTNDLEEIDEDYLFPGEENGMILETYVAVWLDCKFDLLMYPFDSQLCPIKLGIPANYDSQFVLLWDEFPKISDIQIGQYEVAKKLSFNNTNATQNEVTIHIKLHRKLSNHIFTTYIPTFRSFGPFW